MTDNGTLRDHLADVINERNELLRKVELLEARIAQLYDENQEMCNEEKPCEMCKEWDNNND